MTVYSHSRLSCYEQCPQKFKLQYIEKLETEEEQTVEAFLGIRVHEALEKLYRDLAHQKRNTLEELLGFFTTEWDTNWTDDISIVREEYHAENYLNMGKKYLSDYYQRYHPFNQGKTVALEDLIRITLDAEGNFKLQGYIDRLTETRDGFYEIHDYKTNSRMPLADYIRSDRQLALYMIGVQNQYPDVKDVKLIWHFLKFDKEIDSTRTDKELAQLKKDTIQLIETIEDDERYEAHPGYLCDWCEYQSCCPQWSHLHLIKEKPANEYLKDSGVVLVNRYAEVRSAQKLANLQWDAELEKLEEALSSFAEKEHVEVVFGSKNKVRVTDSEKYSFPSKNSKEREQLEKVLQKYGRLQDVSQLDTAALGKVLQEKQWELEVLEALQTYIQVERKKRFYLSKIKE
ncbi:MAG: PD-(D/E)XK nuclease family protein [Euryarchaeota archaeon]|jgi:putative RecB family exonuclease|nr:PD-(D/E)XK nuclease family protein [Euryarchaeota archaeon]